jgi:hypothetical protein
MEVTKKLQVLLKKDHKQIKILKDLKKKCKVLVRDLKHKEIQEIILIL